MAARASRTSAIDANRVSGFHATARSMTAASGIGTAALNWSTASRSYGVGIWSDGVEGMVGIEVHREAVVQARDPRVAVVSGEEVGFVVCPTRGVSTAAVAADVPPDLLQQAHARRVAGQVDGAVDPAAPRPEKELVH